MSKLILATEASTAAGSRTLDEIRERLPCGYRRAPARDRSGGHPQKILIHRDFRNRSRREPSS